MDAAEKFQTLRAVIVDEWHELMGSKRGSQVELALSHLKGFVPELRIWGLSATLANMQEAAQTVVGADRLPIIIQADLPRPILLETLIPENIDAFPWAGHIGLAMLSAVIDRIDISHSTLIFTNTRNQAERWYQAMIDARPDWIGLVVLHHGSLRPKNPGNGVEAGLKDGSVESQSAPRRWIWGLISRRVRPSSKSVRPKGSPG